MNDERFFLDTVFIQALLNRRDQYHEQAKELLPQVRQAREVWTTEAVLVEVGNALSKINRTGASTFIRQCYHTENMHVVTVDTSLLERALMLYATRTDKAWGLTDCLSFVVMEQEGVTTAVTADAHFVQAGFQILLSTS